MYLLLCIALLGSAASIPYKGITTDDYSKNDALSAQYVLPGESFPTFYDVQLFLDPDNEEYFTGKVAIRVIAYETTDQLVLHAMEMTINNVTVTNDLNNVNIFDSFTIANDDTQLLKIKLNTAISAMQPHTIFIDYTGQYAQNMFGIYVSTYESSGQGTEKVITSQLQPTFARRAFPCYDEPALKAVFRTTIYAPPAYPVVRSNMPERSDQLKPNVQGYLKHEFEDTLVMSPYLLAYLVSKFLSIENDSNPLYHVPFKVFSRPGTQTTAEFALDFGQKNMKALDEYTELPYAFPKIDKAAVPDFAAGAMENWGLVIYREAALLVQDGVTTTKMKQSIAKIICHENTHMWFGNEVSPQSWTYTWLNEGFANFFENFGTDLVLPEYRMMDQFVFLMQNVMQSDAVLGVNPMTHPVYTPSQILGTFNAVAYQKSGSVIRMLQNFLTPEVFRQGLVKYLKANSRKAAVPSDLYAALQEALDESNHTIPYSIGTVLTGWSSQGGFPVLTVRRAAPTAESVVVSQERYLTDPTQSSYERWHVPINWVLSTDPDFSNTSPQAWVPWSFPAQSYHIPGLSQTEWFIFNKQQTGYYRVNYDPENWAAISKVLNSSHETIHVLNRAQILDDSFNLARNGRLNYQYPLEISSYLLLEKDYIPWESANAAFEYLNNVLSGSEVYELFQQHLLELTAPLFEELGFVEKTNDEVVTAFHRNIILDINCRHGNPVCVETAQELLEQFRNDPTQSMNPDIQTVVFCSGLRGGDVDNFNFLWDRYLASDDSGEQSILLSALGCTSNEEMRTFYLNQVIDDNSPVREQDKSSIITAVTNASPENAQAALDFVIENFAEIQPRVQGLTGTTNILNTFASRLNTQAHNEKLDEFVSRYQSIFTAGEQAAVGAIRENIAASITWNQQNLGTVVSWIQENYGNGVSALTSSLLVFISIFIAVLNY